MVKWNTNRIINGKMTLQEVPVKWRQQVEMNLMK